MTPTTPDTAVHTAPPLESGDRLTCAEFERRYKQTPEHVKAELVEGVVYLTSKVRATHGQMHALMMGWLGTFWASTRGVELFDGTTLRLDLDNEV